ncbi:MAG TPA: hypothetical protein D7I11_02820, partial [Candidatus Poseidoniales archaeon]
TGEGPLEEETVETTPVKPVDVPLPPGASPDPEPSVPLPANQPSEAPELTVAEAVPPTPEVEEAKAVNLPEVVEEVEDVSEIEVELRAFFQELIDAGVEPAAFMDAPRWEDISERAIAEGLETWPILLQMTAME